jgi:hypothetical protein
MLIYELETHRAHLTIVDGHYLRVTENINPEIAMAWGIYEELL